MKPQHKMHALPIDVSLDVGHSKHLSEHHETDSVRKVLFIGWPLFLKTKMQQLFRDFQGLTLINFFQTYYTKHQVALDITNATVTKTVWIVTSLSQPMMD